MLPQHLPRTHRGQGQSANAAVGQIRHLIWHLAATQWGGIGLVWDTLVGSPLPAHVQQMMGPSTFLNAPKCGSGAHHPTRLWQNLLPTEELEEAYATLNDLPHTVNELLDLAGFDSWHMPPGDTTKSTATPPPSRNTTPLQNKTHSCLPGGIGLVINDKTPLERRNPQITLPRSQGNPHGFHQGRHRGCGNRTRTAHSHPWPMHISQSLTLSSHSC